MYDKDNIENTTRFKSKLEAVRYLDFLGGNKVDITSENPFTKQEELYTFDNMILKFNKEYNSFEIQGDLPSNIQLELAKPPFNDYFYNNHILNLEGLIYLHTLNKTNIDDVIANYEKSLHTCREWALFYELNRSSIIYNKRNFAKENPTNELNEELKNNLNKLCSLVYPFSIPSIEENFHELVEDTIFHSESTDSYIKYTWHTNYGNIICVYKNVWTFQEININICYEDGRSETLSYTSGNDWENIKYYPLEEVGIYKKLDLLNNTITNGDKNKPANKYDFDDFNKVVVGYCNLILKELPYIKGYIENNNKNNKK